MRRTFLSLFSVLLAALALSANAWAAGGNYTFDGGTAKEQAQVKAALNASSFDWNVVPAQVTIHVRDGIASRATRGHVWLDSDVLASGRSGWAVVQDEYAHQVDFFLFDGATRAQLNAALGGRDWCYGTRGLNHSDYGCERFASTLVWSYWQSKHNAYKPSSSNRESAAMSPAAFRALLANVLAQRVPLSR